LVHRDLKPDNIMFGHDTTEPVLVDFGIARHLHEISLTPTWAAMGPGTPLFTSPEQINNQKALIDWRSDQFSLGVVLSQCLIGRHPYQQDGDSQSDIVDRVIRRDGPSPAFLATIADYQWQPVARMVQPWNYQRYRFPAEMLSRLQALRS
jgi:serine/threonine protein kinase